MIDFQSVNVWYKNLLAESVAKSVAGFSGGLSLPGRPAHTLTYPWPRTIPCQLRSPKDIIKSQDNYLLGKRKGEKNVLKIFGICTDVRQLSRISRNPGKILRKYRRKITNVSGSSANICKSRKVTKILRRN